jgi:two-component system, NarL family, sensor histidine kinase DesK
MGESGARDGGCGGWSARPRGRSGKYGALVWLAVWLWPLAGPVVATARGLAQPAPPAALGLAVFVVLYLVTMVFAWSERPPPGQRMCTLLGVLAAVGLALAAGYAGGPAGWLVVLVFVGVAGAAALRPAAQVFGWLAGVVAATVAVGLAHGVPSGELSSTAFSVFMSGVLVFVVRRMNYLIAQLRATQAELAEVAVSQERLRFSRDLHDLLGHTLSVIVVKAAVVRRTAERDPGVAAREAGEIEEIGRRALVEVREAVTGYRERRFVGELASARKALTGAGIEASVRIGDDPLPPAAESVFGWAVREGVTNVIRHSGARRCDIDIQQLDGYATLEIRDDGAAARGRPGWGPAGWGAVRGAAGNTAAGNGGQAGNGLRGIAERVRAAGGTFEAGRPAEGGFRLTATIPLADVREYRPQLLS